MKNKEVLFILKRREDFDPVTHTKKNVSTGLYNSASFVQEMLNDLGVKAELEVAIDNNCIDRLVTKHRPSHVIIEALWVVPSKFDILSRLHPNVKWIIRLHSEMPFMAGEGIAMDWLGDYVSNPNVYIGVNAPRMLDEVKFYLKVAKKWSDEVTNDRVIYLPNYYPNQFEQKVFDKNKNTVDVGCFGAVRPLKNHMLQAVASLKFAEKINKKLRFHINSGRIEMQGQPAMHNLMGFFQHLHGTGHEMVMHYWSPREEFLKICAKMDIGVQCSFSETFNIVCADLISVGTPILGSSEIPWSNDKYNCNPTNSDEISEMLVNIYNDPDTNVNLQQQGLAQYVNETKNVWGKYFKG